MNVAVTGAAGHIGGNLVRALLARGERVRVLVRNDDRAVRGLDITIVRGDARERDAIDALVAGVDVVFNLAAKISIDPREAAEVEAHNVEGPRNVARACLERKLRLVHFSSIHALATHDGPIDETRPLADSHRFAYDRSKARGERQVLDRIPQGLDAVIVNPTAVIGPFDFRPSHMGQTFLQLARRELPSLVDGGFDWVDVRDVVASAIAAAEKGRTGERYLLSGGWRSVRELAHIASAATGVRPPLFNVPIGVARIGVPFARAYARLTNTRPIYTGQALEALRNHRDVRHDKATRELGHHPRPLEDTVRDVYAWFREAGVLPVELKA